MISRSAARLQSDARRSMVRNIRGHRPRVLETRQPSDNIEFLLNPVEPDIPIFINQCVDSEMSFGSPNFLRRNDGSYVLVRRSWSHLTGGQRDRLRELFTHFRCSEICPVSGFKAQKVFGINYPPFINEENVSELRENFQTQASDIFVIAYPKSGSQWVLSTLNCLETGESIAPGNENRMFPWPERDGLLAVEKLIKNRRIFKSHAPSHLTPWKWLHPETKIIYIMRNPKDALVSFYQHAIQRSHPQWITPGEFCDYTGDLDNFFKLFVSGSLPFGDYYEHVAFWWQLALENPKQILWVNYEDIKTNFLFEVSRMGKFCDLGYDKDTITWVKDETSFNHMKKTYGNSGHFRKGVIGDWKNHLTQFQCEYLDTKFRQVLEPLGLRNYSEPES